MPTTTGTTNVAGDVCHRQSSVLSRLASEDHEVKLRALREIKNQIIGNRTKKLSFLKLGAVSVIASVLADSADGGGASDKSTSSILVQSAAALGSFACGLDAGVMAVLDANAFHYLVRLLSNPDEKVVDAGARSLRMIYQSKLAPKYDFLQDKNMEFLISLLNNANENVRGLGASIISRSCGTYVEQKVLCTAGVLEKLLSLLDGSLSQRDAGIESLAAILRNNPEAVSRFVELEGGRALSSVIELAKDRHPRTRLLASLCLIVIRKTSCHLQDVGSKTKLINLLLELLDDPGQVGDDAAFGFATFVADQEDIQKLAHEANAIDKLSDNLQAGLIRPKRVEGLLLALAEMCSKLEECRSRFLSLQVLNLLTDALIHDSADVRTAACICLRNSARSIKNLSAGLFTSEKVVLSLIHLLRDPSTSVQVAALGAISNVVVDFSTSKSTFIECGGVKQLIELSKSMDPVLRTNSLLSLKNLMFLADIKLKEVVCSEIRASLLATLITDPESSVQEQALALLRNLVDGSLCSLDYVFEEDGLILDAVFRQLRKAAKPEMAVQGVYVLTNVASGNELHKEAVTHQIFSQADVENPNFIVKFLQSSDNRLRAAAVWTVLNLTSPSSPGAFSRHIKLRNVGIISQLKNMVNDPCLDVKLRVRTVLGQSMTFGDS